jgi:hypothetical protein
MAANNFNVGGLIVSAEAENAMTERYVVVEIGTAEGQVDLPSATSDIPFGIIQETAVAGQAVPVMINGISQCVAGGAVALGALVYLQATTGRVDDVDTGTAVGLALTAAAADGELIVVDLSYKGNA